MTALSYYGLSFNPFDKQQVKEKDWFLSQDLLEMLNRLDYLKDTRGIGVFTAGPGMGKSFACASVLSSIIPSPACLMRRSPTMSATSWFAPAATKPSLTPIPSSPLSAAATLFDTFHYPLAFGL